MNYVALFLFLYAVSRSKGKVKCIHSAEPKQRLSGLTQSLDPWAELKNKRRRHNNYYERVQQNISRHLAM